MVHLEAAPADRNSQVEWTNIETRLIPAGSGLATLSSEVENVEEEFEIELEKALSEALNEAE